MFASLILYSCIKILIVLHIVNLAQSSGWISFASWLGGLVAEGHKMDFSFML